MMDLRGRSFFSCDSFSYSSSILASRLSLSPSMSWKKVLLGRSFRLDLPTLSTSRKELAMDMKLSFSDRFWPSLKFSRSMMLSFTSECFFIWLSMLSWDLLPSSSTRAMLAASLPSSSLTLPSSSSTAVRFWIFFSRQESLMETSSSMASLVLFSFLLSCAMFSSVSTSFSVIFLSTSFMYNLKQLDSCWLSFFTFYNSISSVFSWWESLSSMPLVSAPTALLRLAICASCVSIFRLISSMKEQSLLELMVTSKKFPIGNSIRIIGLQWYRMDQGCQFLSMSALQRVTSPANCFILGCDHPPKGLKSLKACRLSQWAYQRGTEAALAQAEVLPTAPCHITAEEQMPGVLPLALMALMVSMMKLQLLAESWPLQEHPELGLVSTSIQIVEYSEPVTPLISSLTCEVAFFPLQGNMQTSVARPAVLAFCKLVLALLSRVPVERKARTMAKELPAFLRQVKVETVVGLAMSIPLAARDWLTRRAARVRRKKFRISNNYQSYVLQYFGQGQLFAIKIAMQSEETEEKQECRLEEEGRGEFIAEMVAADAIEWLIDAVLRQHDKNLKFKENLKRFSSMKIVTDINEVSSLNFYESVKNYSTLRGTNEPRPLFIDSLLPISAELDKENAYKLSLKRMMQSEVSSMSKARRQSPQKTEKRAEYLKLQMEQGDEEDGFTKELRKMQEDRESKERNEQRTKEAQEKEQKEKQASKKKEKQQKFSFDYSGLPIKIRTDSKNNLISKLLNGDPNSKTQVDKQAFNDPNPQVVDSIALGKKKNTIGNALKKRDEVDFQENRSLAEGVSVGAGVKYVYEGKTIEGKRKAVSTLELKRTLKDRRLNKEEFERIKATNGSSLQLLAEQTDFRQTINKRSQSQAKPSKKSKESSEKITVNNAALKEKMLQRVNEMLQERRQATPPSKFEYVGQTDIFNMNYLKGKESKSQKTLGALSTQRSLLLFPKIARDSSKNCLPKERERIKEINTVIYQIRRRFDEKLKI